MPLFQPILPLLAPIYVQRIYLIAGFVDDDEMEKSRPSFRPLSPILGPLNRVEQIIEQIQPDRIIVALRERRGRMPLSTLLKAHWAGVVVEDGIKVHERFSGKIAVESLTPGFLIFATDFKKPRIEAFLRRSISLIVALGGLILTAPLLMLIAVAIKLDSRGRVFFIQERAGLNGRIFRLIKFRTILKNCGSSSKCVLRSQPPMRVTREFRSRFQIDVASSEAGAECMVRNFIRRKMRPFSPARS